MINSFRRMRRWSPGAVRVTIFSQTLYVLCIQVLSRGVLNVVTIAAAHLLAVETFSAYNYFLIQTAFLGSLISLGLPVAMTKAVAENTLSPSGSKTATILAIFMCSALVGIVGYPAVLLLAGSKDLALSTVLLTGGSAAIGLYGICLSGVQAAGAYRDTLIPAAIGAVVLGGCTFATSATGNPTYLFLGLILFYLGPALLYLKRLVLLDLLSTRRLLTPDWSELKNIARTALPTLGAALIFTFVNWWVARQLIQYQSSSEEFAEFAIGMQWFSLALFIPLAASQAIFPMYIRMVQQGELQKKSVFQPALIAFAMVTVLIPLAYPMTPVLTIIYGGEYVFSFAFVLLVLIAAALAAPAGIIGNFIIATKGAGTWLCLYLVYLFVGFFSAFYFPPREASQAAVILVASNSTLLLSSIILLLLDRPKQV